jgi:hypothetical protein
VASSLPDMGTYKVAMDARLTGMKWCVDCSTECYQAMLIARASAEQEVAYLVDQRLLSGLADAHEEMGKIVARDDMITVSRFIARAEAESWNQLKNSAPVEHAGGSSTPPTQRKLHTSTPPKQRKLELDDLKTVFCASPAPRDDVPVCEYDGSCYRRNPFQASPAPLDVYYDDDVPVCEHDGSCFRRNPRHWIAFKHEKQTKPR